MNIKSIKQENWREKVMNARVPSFFKALLIDASIRKSVDTLEGTYYYDYSNAGYELARHIEDYIDESANSAIYELTRPSQFEG